MTWRPLPAADCGALVLSGGDPAQDRYLRAFAAGYARSVIELDDPRQPGDQTDLGNFEVLMAPIARLDTGRALASQLAARLVPVPVPSGLNAGPFPVAYPGEPVLRICLFGPESTGKSTLGEALAAHYRTLMVPEYGRTWTETFGQDCGPEDIRRIVQGHLAGVRAAQQLAGTLLIEDTDPVLTAIWSDVLLGERDPWFESFSDAADLYLLTGTDVPWVADGIRYFPQEDERRGFHTRCREELERRGLPFVEVSGDRSARLATAITAIDAAMARLASGGRG